MVGLGTQQFTVLALHDRWVELTPRANLRHFPDMARGYLMWFYYNGFIHFAGQAKPRTICGARYSDNDLRINTYAPWAMTILSLQKTCQPQPQPQPQLLSAGAAVPPAKTGFGLLQADGCADLLLRAPTFPALLALVGRLTAISADDNLWYVRLGALSSDLSGVEPLLRLPPVPAPKKPAGKGSKAAKSADSSGAASGATGPASNASDASGAVNASMAGALRLLQGRQGRGLEALDRLVLANASWSLRVVDRDPARLAAADGLLRAQQESQQLWSSRIKRAANSYQITGSNGGGTGAGGGISRRRLKGGGGGGKKDKVSEGRTWGTQHMALCDQLAGAQLAAADHIKAVSADFYSPSAAAAAAAAANGSSSASAAARAPAKCVHLLPEIKAQGKKHWDVIGIVIDYQPTAALPWANRCGQYTPPSFVTTCVASLHSHLCRSLTCLISSHLI